MDFEQIIKQASSYPDWVYNDGDEVTGVYRSIGQYEKYTCVCTVDKDRPQYGRYIAACNPVHIRLMNELCFHATAINGEYDFDALEKAARALAEYREVRGLNG